jgi:hypothetical protein
MSWNNPSFHCLLVLIHLLFTATLLLAKPNFTKLYGRFSACDAGYGAKFTAAVETCFTAIKSMDSVLTAINNI